MEQSNDGPQNRISTQKKHKQSRIPILRNPRHLSQRNTPQSLVQSTMFQNAQNVDISGNARLMNIARNNVVTNNVTNVAKYDGTHGLEKMEKFVSFSAQFDSSAQDPERICHPGTRRNVLKCVQDWFDDPSSTERIFWIHGPAGAGKSAIAQTIAQSCGPQQVIATFFFFRSDASRNNGNMLFTTLAYQLAFSIPAIRDYIAQYLHDRPDLPTKSVETQFEHLIALPFQSLLKAAEKSSMVSIIDAVHRCRQLAPVIIIDGVDECTDDKIQQRFLKIIGNAVKDRSFPFRFLICSRPEPHIEDTLNRFEDLTRSIDLSKLDDANYDIEKYLVDEFSRIASERHLGQIWPGPAVIQDLIYKSSGNFIFAAVVIKVVGDEDNIPEDQLDIILNLKPPERTSPFAVLDELYLEILRRQLHQGFLKTFLALLVGRTAISEIDPKRRHGFQIELHDDDPELMNVTKNALYTKLRKMRSLLRLELHIDVHHRSFLDFLNEPSRSGDYYVGKQSGTRRYLELVVNSIARYVSKVIENPDYHNTQHLQLKFWLVPWMYPLPMDLPIEELQDVAQPLLQIQDEILERLDLHVASNLLACSKCVIFNLMRPLLLHLALHQCISAAYNEVEDPVTMAKDSSIMGSSTTNLKATHNVPSNDLDDSLSTLLTHLQKAKLELSLNAAIIDLTHSILQFDCVEIATRLRSMSDAQRLVDFLFRLIDGTCILNHYSPDSVSKVARVIMNIFVRVPILPQSLCLNVKRITSVTHGAKAGTYGTFDERWHIAIIAIEDTCRAALLSRVLDEKYVFLEMKLYEDVLFVPGLDQWRWGVWGQVLHLDSIKLALEMARAIQYLDSMGVTLHATRFDTGDTHLDLSVRQKIRATTASLFLTNPFKRSTSKPSIHKDNAFAFGCFFYSTYFDTNFRTLDTIKERSQRVSQRPTSRIIPEYMWQLIQRCCAEDPRDRPTIGEVVKEMEMWRDE